MKNVKRLIRIILFALMVAFTASFLGCDFDSLPDSATEANTTNEAESVRIMPQSMPDDFYIIKEWGNSVSSWYTEFDTFNNKLGDYTIIGYVDVDFTVSNEVLNEIYEKIIEYDVISFCDSDVLTDSNYIANPNRYVKISFYIDGTLHTVIYDSTIGGEEYRNLMLFNNMLCELYVTTAEWESIPERPFSCQMIIPAE